jgi:hypothetical protein
VQGEENGKQESRRVGSLQAAVLLAMPSPARAKAHDDVGEESQRCSFGKELAIGLVEVPWTRKDEIVS